MQHFFGKLSFMAAIGMAVFLLAACAGTQSGVQPIPRSANPADVVNEFDVEITTARKNQLNVLSPGWFAKAETSLARAKKALSKGDEISEIMENVTKGRAQLKTAEEDEVNEHLSQQRAEAVRQYLVANQTLPYDHIMAVGYGSMRPLASNLFSHPK